MSRLLKYATVLVTILLTSMALAMATSAVYAQEPPPTDQTIPAPDQFPPSIPLPAQGAQQAYVTVVAAVGGTTSPAPGAYVYPTGDWFNLTAVPYKGFKFLYWTISGSYLPGHNLPPIVYPNPVPPDWVPDLPNQATAGWDSLITSQNPLNVICGYGYNFQYQPVFAATSATNPGNNTIVTLVDALGGTSKVIAGSVTDDAPGTYTFASGQGLTLEATANDGYAFSYWIAKGEVDAVIVDNPADISCQAGTSYSYQPVFVPHNAPAAEPSGIPALTFYAVVIVLVIIVIVVLAVALMYRARSKK